MSHVVKELTGSTLEEMRTPKHNSSNLHPQARIVLDEHANEESSTASDNSSDSEDYKSEDEAANLTHQLAQTAVSVREMAKQLGTSLNQAIILILI